jgi:hypothetical protein
MHFYRERLSAPPLWWVVGMLSMLTFGAIVWTGFDLGITIAVFAVLIGITAAFLLNWGRATIEVTAGELRAGDATLPLALAGEVRALDEAQTMALRGSRADPRLLPHQALPQARGVCRGHRTGPGCSVLAGGDEAPGRTRGCYREFTPRGQPRRHDHDMIGHSRGTSPSPGWTSGRH